MKTVTVSIKGVEWTIRFMTLKAFLKKHQDELDGTDFFGITNVDKSIDLVINKTTPQLIRHELLHAFVRETLTESVALDSDGMEELCATIIEYHLPDFVQLTDKILTAALSKG